VPSPADLVRRFGGHPAAALGLDLEGESGLFGWLAAACLLSGRSGEERALAAFRALAAEDLARVEALAADEPARIARRLAAAGTPRAEQPALLLVRLARSLSAREGGLAGLLAGASDLASAGESLVRLAPGLGPATALRFLRPLRARFPAARETPLAAPARAAALHLGWIAEGDDEDGAPDALAARLRRDPDAPALACVEAALERLGRRSCAAPRPERCALAEACPLR
jgi:hypothetical protein